MFSDYEVVKKVKFFGRRAGHRASSLRRTFSSSKNMTWWSSNREKEEEMDVEQANKPSLPDITVPWSGEIKTSDNPLTATKKNIKKKAKEVELISMKKVKKTRNPKTISSNSAIQIELVNTSISIANVAPALPRRNVAETFPPLPSRPSNSKHKGNPQTHSTSNGEVKVDIKDDALPTIMHRNPHWKKLKMAVKTANTFRSTSSILVHMRPHIKHKQT